MREYIAHLPLVLCLLLFAASVCAAQNPGSLEYYVKYGREYFEAGNYESAANYFRQGAGMYPNNAEVHFYLGQAYLKMNKAEEAKAEFQKAIELNPSLKKQVNELVGGDDGEVEDEAGDRRDADEKAPLKSRADSAPFKDGDEVEAKLYTSEQWVRGTVVAARDQYGDGKAFIYRVRYRGVSDDWVEGEFYPGRVRAVTQAPGLQKQDKPAVSGRRRRSTSLSKRPRATSAGLRRESQVTAVPESNFF